MSERRECKEELAEAQHNFRCMRALADTYHNALVRIVNSSEEAEALRGIAAQAVCLKMIEPWSSVAVFLADENCKTQPVNRS